MTAADDDLRREIGVRWVEKVAAVLAVHTYVIDGPPSVVCVRCACGYRNGGEYLTPERADLIARRHLGVHVAAALDAHPARAEDSEAVAEARGDVAMTDPAPSVPDEGDVEAALTTSMQWVIRNGTTEERDDLASMLPDLLAQRDAATRAAAYTTAANSLLPTDLVGRDWLLDLAEGARRE